MSGPSSSSRLDTELVRRGLARSRGHARELIEGGRVSIEGQPASKVSLPVPADAVVNVSVAGPQWVSRAAYKLVGALETFGPQGLRVEGRRCLDVGASTGGFTQVLLHHGAARVVALDVGHGQLAGELSADPRVDERSGTTVRGLEAAAIGGAVDLLVADLSFISLTLVLDTCAGLLTPAGDAVVLVKPQFEVGRERLGKGGIVRRRGDRAWAITEVARAALAAGLYSRDLVASPIRGGEGNAEYLLWVTPRADGALGWEALVSAADEVTADD